MQSMPGLTSKTVRILTEANLVSGPVALSAVWICSLVFEPEGQNANLAFPVCWLFGCAVYCMLNAAETAKVRWR
jgi:uncharacterized membrane protein YbhN (UPF0104 family)